LARSEETAEKIRETIIEVPFLPAGIRTHGPGPAPPFFSTQLDGGPRRNATHGAQQRRGVC